MSKKMRTGLKKSVSMIVAVATIVWLSGLAILLTPAITIVADERPSVVVEGITVYDGDLISSNATNSDGSPTYASLDIYIAKVVSATETYKRLVLNPQVFDSYGHLNWGDVQEVDQSVMDAFSTSCLTREDGDTKVYAMAPDDDTGTKSWVNLTESEFVGAATGSYSANTAGAIYTINSTDAGNYTATGDLTAVSAFETYLSDGTLPAVSGAGTGLIVALSSTTPASTSIIADSTTGTAGAQAMVPMTAVNFTAANDGDVIVSTVKFKRGGIPSADVDFSAFYLYDGSELVAEYSSISSGVLTFTKSAGLFTVSAGATKTLTLKMDVAEDLAASRTSKWSIVDATYVDAGSSVVSGTFPIDGNQMSSAQVADLGNLTIATSSDSATVDAGETDFEMWRFSLVAEGQDMEVSYLKFTNIGTVDNVDDIQNITLKKNDGTQYGDTKATFESDGTLTFDLSADPITVSKGNTDYYSVRGDIVGGTNRTFKLSVQQMYHIVAKDKEYNVYTKVNLLDSWTVIQASQTTTVNTGTMTVSRNTTSPSGNVPLSGLAVEVAHIDFAAVGENVKIASLPIKVARTAGSSVGLYAVKAYVDGSQIGSTTHLTADNTAQTFSFGNNFIVPAGETKTLVLKADIKEGDGTVMTDADTFTVTVNAGTASGVTSLEAVTLTAQPGHLLTVSENALSTAKNASMAEGSADIPNGVAGSSGVRVGSAVITAGAGEAVDVTSISLTEGAGVDPFTSLQNVVMKKADGTQIGAIKASVTADSTYTFVPSSAIRLTASESIVVDVFADIKSGVSAGSKGALKISLVNGIGVTTNTSANDSTGATLQVVWVIANGALTTTIDGATPSSAQLVAGSADNHIATFSAEETTGAEDVTLTKIIVNNTTSADNTLINWALYDGETGTQIGTTVPVSASGVVTFNSVSWTIPAGETKTLKVKVGVSSYTAAVENTANFAYLASGNGNAFEGSGSGSGTITITVGTSDINANTVKVYRTVLNAASKTTSNEGGTYGATQEIAKIGLTSSATYNAKLQAASVNAVADNTNWVTEIGAGAVIDEATLTIDGACIELNEDGSATADDSAFYAGASAAGLNLDLSGYKYAGFWIMSDVLEAASDVEFCVVAGQATVTSALCSSNPLGTVSGGSTLGKLPALTANIWDYVEVDISGITDIDDVDGYGINFVTGLVTGQQVYIDNIKFYNDSINVDISGDLGTATTSDGLAFYLKDASGTTKMTGYLDNANSESAATVMFVPGASDISIGNSEQVYTITTNTTTLMATDTSDDQNLNVNIDLGDSSATGVGIGDVRWYDGAITATSPITWTSGAGPLTWSFSY